jgi:hypothetical protein
MNQLYYLALIAACNSLLITPTSVLAASSLRLTPTARSNDLGNPIYRLSAIDSGAILFSVDAVSGTARSQHRDRHKGDNYAPLPDGSYDIGQIEPGINPEAGKNFIRIRPRFKTRRTHLGIHVDVSYNRRNGRDGTAGCVGITRRSDRDRVIKWVRRYKPQKLRVRIA